MVLPVVAALARAAQARTKTVANFMLAGVDTTCHLAAARKSEASELAGVVFIRRRCVETHGAKHPR